MSIYKRPSGSQSKGKVVYNIGIVKGIVCLAVEDVSGVAIQNKKRSGKGGPDGIKVIINNEGISVDVSVNIYYGYNVPDVAFNIQQNIKHSVESMTKYKIDSVDVKVSGVIIPVENTIE